MTRTGLGSRLSRQATNIATTPKTARAARTTRPGVHSESPRTTTATAASGNMRYCAIPTQQRTASGSVICSGGRGSGPERRAGRGTSMIMSPLDAAAVPLHERENRIGQCVRLDVEQHHRNIDLVRLPSPLEAQRTEPE